MSKSKLFAMLFIVISLAIAQELELGSSLVELQTAYTKQRIKLLSLKSFLKNQMIEKLQIEFENQDNVQEVVSFLEQISQEIHNQYLQLLAEYSQKKAKVRSDMTVAKKIITINQNKLEQLINNQHFLEKQMDLLSQKIKILLRELINLGTRDKLLNEILKIDQEMYSYRKFRDESTIYSLNLCIEKLQQLQSKRSLFPQKDIDYIKQNLKKIPLKNPLNAFVLISQKFNEQKLNQTIHLLLKIRNSIQVSYKDDREKEQISIERYASLIFIGKIQKQRLIQQVTSLNNKLDVKQLSLQQNFVEQQFVSKIIDLEQNILVHYAILARQLDQNYEKRILEAEDAKEGVEEALNILNQHLYALLVLDFQKDNDQQSRENIQN
ncbi:hypothetical protein TTHERM_00011660 (macronuclear) [Tetrahymena thermophila SB210]|uniref:Transmembrane protein n=1 Tax=Tetrahymena thermophila (strain SB210) TaxID=312017 RepID=Q22RX2_TETTS|nr:hypothetical protein TTHERM_00011660 [Tetrahymena thermophila SB210]EAR88000.1 hypothetical protein TTHERM_00011660 [Tetrahymena thermophila SB210]|eukprot:XP_001008245.1 hypothetical protein TTHERM_00011660 [Tetrahymena thermophila SB210]